MSQAKFTASERADKCVLSLEQAIYQTTKRERGLVGAICSIYGLDYNTILLSLLDELGIKYELSDKKAV